MSGNHAKGKANKAPQNLSKIREESNSSSSSGEGVATAILDAVSRYWKFLLVALPAIFALTLYKQSSAVIRNLTNAPDDALKEAIFGDQPHLFYCDRELPAEARKKDNALEGLPGLFTQLNNLKGQEMTFAVLNCSQTLPSGKTILERFQLKREVKPIIFGNAPWLFKPQQLLPVHLKNIDTMRKHVEEAFLTPKSIGVKSDKEFHSVCAFAKNVVLDDRDISHTCFAIVRGDKYAQNAKLLSEFEKRLVLDYPKARFVAMNGKQLRLSFEDVEATPHDDFALRVHAVRNGSHFLSMDKPVTWDYLDNFVSQAVSAPLYSFDKHAEKDAVRLIKPAQLAKKAAKKKLMEEKQKKKQEQKEEGQKKKKEQQREEARQRRAAAAAAKKENKESENKNENTESDVDEVDLDVEERVTPEQTKNEPTSKESEQKEKERDLEAERQERLLQEQRRREEMERQAREQVFEARDDVDEDAADDEEHDEEHIIEL